MVLVVVAVVAVVVVVAGEVVLLLGDLLLVVFRGVDAGAGLLGWLNCACQRKMPTHPIVILRKRSREGDGDEDDTHLHAGSLVLLCLLLLPHFPEPRQGLVIGFLGFKRIERLPQDLLHAHVPSLPQQLFDRGDEPRVDVSREGLAWVVRQYPDQHDRVVLDICPLVVLCGQELSDR